jgi:hypothetical protein
MFNTQPREIAMARSPRLRLVKTAKPAAPLPEVISDDAVLTRAQAAQFIRERFNVQITETALALLVTNGGGPRFRRFGRRVYYQVADLREWVTAGLSEAYVSSADYRQRRRAKTPPSPAASGEGQAPLTGDSRPFRGFKFTWAELDKHLAASEGLFYKMRRC